MRSPPNGPGAGSAAGPDPAPDPAAADPVVSLDGVTKTYQLGGTVTALDDVSVSLDAGSYTAVMGPSGSGKSTLLNLIGGLDTADTGTVRVDGVDLGSVSESQRAAKRGTAIGFVFQTFNLMPRLTAVENVALPLVFDGWTRSERLERARQMLDDVGLGDRHDHKPAELSGGQRQRVAIARALAPNPSLLLADEPTGNVDTDTGAAIMRLLADIHDRGNTILLVSHARRIAEHAERIVHVRDGRLERVETVGRRRPHGSDDGGTGSESRVAGGRTAGTDGSE
ncbi:ABC transporter ATP-binding protein [Halobellus ruber]|uniref:ABC transporter ATP-binding protein n=1 Tax=Halobellus ruber TaxID=2761102 RepID=A0A7J9SMF1_9EURY|nr:ABC transporter ATP-binding protein [Halobellus ruber]MBB6647593.1 ABC transporter ATP-binding protein [Halobellus ruber]